MMTKVINRHRQGRDSRDPEQSLEIDREQLKAANCNLGTYSARNAGHSIVLLSLPSIAGPRLKE
jgi:hypothetical protein